MDKIADRNFNQILRFAEKRRDLKKLKLLLLLTAMSGALLSGCANKKEVSSAEDILTKVQEASTSYKSAEMGINMSISSGAAVESESEAEELSFSVELGGTSSVVLNPEISKMEGTMKVNLAGQENESDLLVYTKKEDDGQYTTYIQDATAGWYKMTAEVSEYDYNAMMNYDALKDLSSSLKVSKEEAEVKGVKCYELTGTLTGEDLKTIYSNYENMGLAEGELKNYSVDLTLAVDKETYRPQLMTLSINSTEDAATQMTCEISITFESYDSIDSIEIPDEAINAQDIGSLY